MGGKISKSKQGDAAPAAAASTPSSSKASTPTKKQLKAMAKLDQCPEQLTAWNEQITESQAYSHEWKTRHPEEYGCGLIWISDGYSGTEWRNGHYTQINRIRDKRWMPERTMPLGTKTVNWQYVILTCGSREKYTVNEYTLKEKSEKGECYRAPHNQPYFCRDCLRRVQGDFTTNSTDQSRIEQEFADDPNDDEEIVVEAEDEVVVDGQGTVAKRVRARKGNRAAVVLYDKATGQVIETTRVDDVEAARKQARKDARNKYKLQKKEQKKEDKIAAANAPPKEKTSFFSRKPKKDNTTVTGGDEGQQ